MAEEAPVREILPPKEIDEAAREWRDAVTEFVGWTPDMLRVQILENPADPAGPESVQFTVENLKVKEEYGHSVNGMYGFGADSIWGKLLAESVRNPDARNDTIMIPSPQEPLTIDGVKISTEETETPDRLRLKMEVSPKNKLGADTQFFSRVVGVQLETYFASALSGWEPSPDSQLRPTEEGGFEASFIIESDRVGKEVEGKIRWTGPDQSLLRGDSGNFGLTVTLHPGIQKARTV